MPIPEVTAGVDQSQPASALPYLVTLAGSATESPTVWEWTMLSVPSGSSANSGTNNDFSSGTSAVQNPQFTCDVEGTYVLQLRAQNATGWSVPSVDKAAAQTVVHIRTALLDLELPGKQQYNWDDEVLGVLSALEGKLAVAGKGWSYLDQLNPSGVGQVPDVLYQFDGTSLADRMGNGPTLSTFSTSYYTCIEGLKGHWFRGSNDMLYSNGQSALQALGDLTVEWIWFLDDRAVSSSVEIFGYGDLAAGTEAYNMNYGARISLSESVNRKRLEYLSENGAGVDEFHISTDVIPSNKLIYSAFTRDGTSGDLKVYHDGQLMQTISGTTLPTGGTDTGVTMFSIGEIQGVSQQALKGGVMCWRKTDAKFSDAHIGAAWKQARGIQ